MIAGNVDMMFDMLATSLPLHEGNKVKIVAVGGTERVKALPDVPTLAEAGVPGYRAVTFFGMVAPPQTPAALADKINATLLKFSSVRKWSTRPTAWEWTRRPVRARRRLNSSPTRWTCGAR